MKNFIIIMYLLVSVAASASELEVMKVSAKKAGRGSLSTRFEVNLNDNTAGVSVKITRRNSGKNHSTSSRSFEMIVADLNLNADVLELNVDGKIVNCGTMGVTRVFKRPVLNLNGNCNVVAKRVNGNVLVSIVTK